MAKLFSAQARENRVFLDERFLYPEFIPEKLPFREEETSALAYCFEPVLAGKKPLNVFMAGPTGVGKTVCAKFVLKELCETTSTVKSLYLNCFEYSSRASVLSAIANFVGSGVPRRGLATDEIFTNMLESMRKCGFTPIVVLDEVDQLLLSEANSKLLYDLLRVIEYEKLRIGIVMISNDVSLPSKLDSRIRSSMAEQTVLFGSYSPEQLKAILSERASLAFVKGAFDKGLVGVAAAHAAKLGGDCRVALESMLKAGRAAERANRAKVSLESLKGAFEDVDAASLLKGLKHLGKDELALLRIVAENQPVTSGRVYEIYSAGQAGNLKERRLRDVMATLEKQGFVSSRNVEFGNKGKSREYSCKAPAKAILGSTEQAK